jgi:hypothetical protein
MLNTLNAVAAAANLKINQTLFNRTGRRLSMVGRL